MEQEATEWFHSQLARYIPASARRVLDCTPEADFATFCGADRQLYGLDLHGTGNGNACAGYREVMAIDPDAPAIPLDNGTMDCVVCDNALAVTRDPVPLLRELARLLVPGGMMVLTLPNLQYHRNVTGLALGQWRTGSSFALAPDHIHFFTAFEAVRLLEKSGFPQPVCEVLAGDRPDQVPLDENNCIVMGRVTIGPLDRNAYHLFLAQRFLLLAAKPLEA